MLSISPALRVRSHTCRLQSPQTDTRPPCLTVFTPSSTLEKKGSDLVRHLQSGATTIIPGIAVCQLEPGPPMAHLSRGETNKPFRMRVFVASDKVIRRDYATLNTLVHKNGTVLLIEADESLLLRDTPIQTSRISDPIGLQGGFMRGSVDSTSSKVYIANVNTDGWTAKSWSGNVVYPEKTSVLSTSGSAKDSLFVGPVIMETKSDAQENDDGSITVQARLAGFHNLGEDGWTSSNAMTDEGHTKLSEWMSKNMSVSSSEASAMRGATNVFRASILLTLGIRSGPYVCEVALIPMRRNMPLDFSCTHQFTAMPSSFEDRFGGHS